MKHLFSLLSPLLLCLLASLPLMAQQKGASQVAAATPHASGQTHALIIGVSNYADSKLDLRFADKDALLFYNFLVKSGTATTDNIRLLLNEEATGIRINAALNQLATHVQEGDIVYIYFSGHGDVQTEIDDTSVGYLLGHDSNAERVYAGTGGTLEFERLQRYINVLGKKKATVNLVLDACHSGAAVTETGSANMSQLALAGFSNSIRFLSCRPTEKSYEDKSIGQGFFTYNLVRGLMGMADVSPKDNRVNIEELNGFVKSEVRSASQGKQTPRIEAVDEYLVIQEVRPDFLEQVLAATKAQQIPNYLAARSAASQSADPAEQLSPGEQEQIARFNALLSSGREGVQQAYTLLQQNKIRGVSPQRLSSFRYALVSELGRQPQEAVNTILKGSNLQPSAAYLLESSRLARQAVSLLDSSDFHFRIYSIYDKYLEAYAHIRNRNYRKYNQAEQLLQEALALEPHSAFVLHGLGLVATYKNDHPLAERYFKKAIEMIPTWTYPRSSLGSSLRDQGRYREALAVFEEVIQMAPTFAAAYNNLATVYQEMGRYNEAEQLYRRAMQADTADVALELNNLGLLYRDRGNLKDAETHYLASIARDEAYGKSYANLGYLYARLEDRRAEAYLKLAVEKEPFYAELLTDLAGYYSTSTSSADRQRADALYQEAVLNNPFETRAYAGRGWNAATENPSLAERYFLEGVQRNPEKPSAHYYLGEWYEQQEKWELAESSYKKALSLNPYTYPAYTRLSSLYLLSGRTPLAEKILLDAVPYFELSPVLFNDIGNFYYAQGQADKALQYYQRSLQTDADYAKAWGSLAYTALEGGAYRDAVDQFRKANQNDPIKFALDDFRSLFVPQMEALSSSGRAAEARAALTHYLAALPAHAELHYALARAGYLSGEPAAALASLQHIEVSGLRVQEKYRYWQQLGWLYLDLGQHTKAREAFTQSQAFYATPDPLGLAVLAYLGKDKAAAKTLLSKALQYDASALAADKLGTRYSHTSRDLITRMISGLER
ncbi:tetratricopeptide repeat protein [Cesiribacter andamanensis]|uniref:Cellulose synthase subunit BcsC n=1 Tax=Cesiribacter andamanensis AMV16 TaxID=1279009 RepID=M7NK67_9BACT|nr:tetratricopeptide repeat protein [Cesiribacter andamanensis]EMR02170.1 cellulose synthase subunit BcsC [Cesiribacter andamanensis AMV16]